MQLLMFKEIVPEGRVREALLALHYPQDSDQNLLIGRLFGSLQAFGDGVPSLDI